MFILQFHIRFPYCINFGTMPKTHQWTEMARRKISAPAEAPDARKVAYDWASEHQHKVRITKAPDFWLHGPWTFLVTF